MNLRYHNATLICICLPSARLTLLPHGTDNVQFVGASQPIRTEVQSRGGVAAKATDCWLHLQLHTETWGSIPGPAKAEFGWLMWGRIPAAPPGALESQASRSRVTLRIIRSTRTAGDRGPMQGILMNGIDWNRWATIGYQFWEQREKSDKKMRLIHINEP